MNQFVGLRYSVLVFCMVLTFAACVLLFRRRRSIATALLLGGAFLGLLIGLVQTGQYYHYLPVLAESSGGAVFRSVMVSTSMIATVASSTGLLLYALRQREQT